MDREPLAGARGWFDAALTFRPDRAGSGRRGPPGADFPRVGRIFSGMGTYGGGNRPEIVHAAVERHGARTLHDLRARTTTAADPAAHSPTYVAEPII